MFSLSVRDLSIIVDMSFFVIASYIGIVAFIAIYAYYKIRHRTRVIPLSEVDLVSGKAEIDADEQFWLAKEAARGPMTFWQRIGDKFV